MQKENETLTFLKNSLLYQTSLGSRELYHSNVWKWLMENDPRFISAFFDGVTFCDGINSKFELGGEKYNVEKWDDDKFKVYRELQHRDIVIELQKDGFTGKTGKYCLVIENKIKSLPDEEQLKNYTANLGKTELLDAVVTGIENSLEWSDDCKEIINGDVSQVWKFVKYRDIAEKIREIAKGSNSQVIIDHVSQIEEYCDVVQSIDELLGAQLAKNKDTFSYDRGDLWAVNLADVFVKLKGSQFMTYVNERKSELEAILPNGFHLDVKQSFNKSKATLDIMFSDWEKDCKDYLTIGVQIEECQYRLSVIRNEKHTVESIWDTFKNDWFDGSYDPKSKKLFGDKHKPTRLSQRYNKYGANSNTYRYVYQYYDIAGEKYEDVFENIKKDWERAKKTKAVIERLANKE